MIEYGRDYTCPHGEPWGDCPKGCVQPNHPPALGDIWAGSAMPGDGHGTMTTEELRRLSLTPASGRIKSVRWLYGHERGGYIPLGKVTLLAGREGIGKSSIAFDLVARVTKGGLSGEFMGKPRGVAIYATEDDWHEVIEPRLLAAGADRNHVFHLEVADEDGEGWLSVPRDLRELGQLCQRHDIAMLVLDPLISVIDGKLDSHKDKDLRRALEPLKRFAEAAELSVLGLIHVNKSQGVDALTSIMGGRAFVSVARSVLFCIRDQQEDAQDAYLFSHEKCNLGPRQPSRRYEIKEAAVESEYGAKVWTSQVRWGEEDARRAGDILDAQNGNNRKGALRNEILAWLSGRGVLTSLREVLDAFPGHTESSVKMTLSRMVQSGEIERVQMGMYQIPRSSNSEGNTSLIVTSVVVDTGVSGVTGVTGNSDEGSVTESPSCEQCGHALWAPQSVEKGLCHRCDLEQETS